jgi:hypothetical protein
MQASAANREIQNESTSTRHLVRSNRFDRKGPDTSLPTVLLVDRPGHSHDLMHRKAKAIRLKADVIVKPHDVQELPNS